MNAGAQSIDITSAQAIRGWMRRAELSWLAHQACVCHYVLEVGSFHGRSTRALADHCPGVVYAVDPWNGEYFNDDNTRAGWIDTNVFGEFCWNLNPHIVAGRVIPRRGAAADVLPQLVAQPGRVFDLAFLDGDHRHAEVLRDIDAALELVRPGGILSGHDYGHPSWPGVKQAVDARYPGAQLCKSIWWVRL